ncbi:WD40 repeat domain-containing protein [Tenggerimyces flavus]|uniref:Uncharacterized protein n=1 Tax=Tenggerimyces flavus TaxID=1708749 RepID=A0ABV7YQN6_9ACTN|nr:hypothetical protein [Tenggerimyces flavus]MBM7786276.1 hypothetical protein [Tenggerimyces flavus]
MNDQGIEQRLREALKSAGAEIAPHGIRPPGLEVRTRERRTRWTLAAAVAAASVTLAFGVPFALLNKGNFDPAGSFDRPKDPAPLELVVPSTPLDFYLNLAWNGGRFSAYSVPTTSDSQPKDFFNDSDYRSAAAAPDRRSFYLARHDASSAACSTRISVLSVEQETSRATQSTVKDTVATGKRYSSLAISPDGRKLAAWYDTIEWDGRQCVTNAATTHGVVVFDLSTGGKRTWTLSTMKGSFAPVGINALSWSLDNRYLAYPLDFPRAVPPAEVLINYGKTALVRQPGPAADQFRYLDTTRPDGTLPSNSREITRDTKELSKYVSVQLLTSNQYYPQALTGFAPQGGARVLAVGLESDGVTRALLEIRLGSGSVSVLDPSYNPNVRAVSW